MSTKQGFLYKALVCCFCSQTACGTAQCYNCWTSYQACGLAYLQQSSCCWALCAPICHQCKLGDTKKASQACGLCFKYCLFSCALYCVAPCDGCYACIMYTKDNCTTGVSGFGDILKHTNWLGKKVEEALGLKTSDEPDKTYKTFTP